MMTRPSIDTNAQMHLLTTENLVVEQLQCIRDDRVLFDNLNFALSSGELLQIEGTNGSGKTTLLRVLCGLTLPTAGTVYWQGQAIQNLKSSYRIHLAYVGHTGGVKAELTPLENLAIAKALSAYPTEITLTTALEQVGLYGFEEVFTRTLSAGQQRRLAIARLLVTKAPLWILDEPLTALDKKAIQMIEQLLDNHVQEGGMVIVTSHQPIHCKTTRTLLLGG